METDITSMIFSPAIRQVSYGTGKDTTETSNLRTKPKLQSHHSVIFEKVTDCIVSTFSDNR